MKALLLGALLASSSIASAQAVATPEAATAATVTAVPLASEPGANSSMRLLRGGAQIRVRFLNEVTTEGRASRVGDRVRLEVAESIILDGVTVIPAGTPVVGELTDVRNKGMWGRSGRIGGRVVSMTLAGRTIRMSGAFDDRGVAGTAGVVAAVLLVPVVGFFVTGTSARIPAGSQANGFLDEDITFSVTAAAPPPIPVAAPQEAVAPVAEIPPAPAG